MQQNIFSIHVFPQQQVLHSVLHNLASRCSCLFVLCNALYRFFTSSALILLQSQSGGLLGHTDREEIMYLLLLSKQPGSTQETGSLTPMTKIPISWVMRHFFHIVVAALLVGWSWNPFPVSLKSIHPDVFPQQCFTDFDCHIPLRYLIMLKTSTHVEHI